MRLAGIIGGAAALGLGAGVACDGPGGSECGPTEAVVARVVDGDTVELQGGERVRYLLVDTPEITNGKNDCFGAEARDFNRDLVEGKSITLHYDVECEDRFGRLLAYVELDGRDVNRLLIDRGFACTLHIPPNGEDRSSEFAAAEQAAQTGLVGLWGACEEVTCD